MRNIAAILILLFLFSCNRKDTFYTCSGYSINPSGKTPSKTEIYQNLSQDQINSIEKNGNDTVYSETDRSNWFVSYYHCEKN